MSNALAHNLDPVTVARAFKESGMFPDLTSEAQAVVKIVAGQELGFGPMASMQAIQMIQGKPTLSANGLAALVKRHPSYNFRVREHTDETCSIEFFEEGESVGLSTFTMEDAKLAGLAGQQTWKKYPKAMLYARALSQGVRWHCPDVTAGSPAYVPEELGGAEGAAPDEVLAIEGALEAAVPLPRERVEELGAMIVNGAQLTPIEVESLFDRIGAVPPAEAPVGPEWNAALRSALAALTPVEADAMADELRDLVDTSLESDPEIVKAAADA
jgi:hypothetical protein